IPEDCRAALIAGGATVVESRELLCRLKGAGLRLTPTQRRRAAADAAAGVTSGGTHPAGREGI
ncbi:MAG: hypothetical protein WKF60_09750, partial [Ilumatobacter sp.]